MVYFPVKHSCLYNKHAELPNSLRRAIFSSPWNENARTKQKQQMNGDRAIWLVYTTDTNARGFWLVKRTLGWKNFMAEELARNHSIIRFDVILQHDWPIEQWLLHIRVFFGGKTKSPCFDLSKTTNEHVPKPFFKVIWKSLYHVPSSTVVFQMNKYKWNITTMQFPRRIWIYLYRYLRLISFEIKKITLKGIWRIMKYNLMP